jgi:hypothetical protein
VVQIASAYHGGRLPQAHADPRSLTQKFWALAFTVHHCNVDALPESKAA